VKQLARILGPTDDLDTGFAEQARDAVARDHRVVGDHNAHGITTPIVVPDSPLTIETVPSIAPTR
jgi:hypothetical protein